MANFPIKKNNFITPEKAAIFLPMIISSIIALIFIVVFSIPKFVESNKVNKELNQFKIKVKELPNLKIQSQIISEKLEKLNAKKLKIIKLISGTTNLETFISRLGLIAENNNIEFKSIKPISSVKFVKNENSAIQDELNINFDQFLVEGVKKYSIDLDLNANYKDLLSFLKELESQENIILFEDIDLNSNRNSDNNETTDDIKDLKVKLKISVYGKA